MERLYDVCHCTNRLSVILIDNNIIQFVRIFAPYVLKLVSLQQHAEQRDSCHLLVERCSARGLEASLGVSKTEVNASINRSIAAGLAHKERQYGYPKANSKGLLEFILHGIKYVFPAKPAELVRGMPTAFDAPILKGELSSGGKFLHVWPDAKDKAMGQAVKPLFKSVPMAAKQDQQLYAYLALIDAIRLGNPRETMLAQKLFRARLNP